MITQKITLEGLKVKFIFNDYTFYFNSFSKIVGYVAIIVSLIIALIAFIITWLVSEFFIPPHDYWSKSGFSVLLVKLGMAGGVAFWVFLIVGQLAIGFFGAK